MAKPERAASVAALCALLLAAGKISLYWYTGSLVVAVSALDSSIDFVVSMVNRKTLIFARSSPDQDHPYGHGKAESIAALGQGALLIGASLAVSIAALQHLIQLIALQIPQSILEYFSFINGHLLNQQIAAEVEAPKPFESWFAVLFFLFAALLSLGITMWLNHNAKKFNSPSLRGDATHYQSDVLTNIGSAAGLTAVYLTGFIWLDPLLAILFAAMIIYSGFDLLRTSVRELMDHDIGEELKKKVESYAKEICPEIIDIHNFRGRQSGHRYLFDFHLTLPHQLTFLEVHEKVELLEMKLKNEFSADAVIHADPDSPEKISNAAEHLKTP